jgi:hypothetical protein
MPVDAIMAIKKEYGVRKTGWAIHVSQPIYLGWREMRQYKWQHYEDNIIVSIWNII